MLFQDFGGLDLNSVQHTGANIYGFSMTDFHRLEVSIKDGAISQVICKNTSC